MESTAEHKNEELLSRASDAAYCPTRYIWKSSAKTRMVSTNTHDLSTSYYSREPQLIRPRYSSWMKVLLG